MVLYGDSVILVYAKAPVAGKVNTRLIADIGVQAATELQFDLIHHRLTMLAEANLCDLRLLCAPDQQHEAFLSCKKQYPITLHKQPGDDLGARMFNGIDDALQEYKYCIVIGTDAPALGAEKIKQAIEVLHDGTEVVFVPAEDGGYVLVAMRQAYKCLFENISWGSAQVMQQSRDILNKNNIPFRELAYCWDVDEPEDYQRYLQFMNA